MRWISWANVLHSGKSYSRSKWHIAGENRTAVEFFEE